MSGEGISLICAGISLIIASAIKAAKKLNIIPKGSALEEVPIYLLVLVCIIFIFLAALFKFLPHI